MEVFGHNLSDVLIQKEKELQEISKLRLLQLEDNLRQKDLIIEDLNQKMLKMQEDFNYNVQLIDERDSELAEIDNKFEKLKKIVKEKDAELSELKANHSSQDQKFKSEIAKLKAQEKLLTQSREDLRAQFNEFKWQKEEEIRYLKLKIGDENGEAERIIKQKEEEFKTNKLALVEKYEAMLRNKEETHSKIVLELEKEIKNLTTKLSIQTEKLEEFQIKNKNCDTEEKLKELDDLYSQDIAKFEAQLNYKDQQIQKLIEQVKYFQEKLEESKSKLQNEISLLSLKAQFLEKENSKLKAAHEEELKYTNQANEMQIQRLNSSYTTQINRLQERLSAAEDESEKSYIKGQQLREKHLQQERKSAQELIMIEESHKRDIISLEETIKQLKIQIKNKQEEIENSNEKIQNWKSKAEQNAEEVRKLRINLQENEIKLQGLKSDIDRLKRDENNVQKIKFGYEEKIKELINKFENNVRPMSPISNGSEKRRLEDEIEEYKEIIYQMRKTMEEMNQKGFTGDVDMKNQLEDFQQDYNRMKSERDQIASAKNRCEMELKEIKMMNEKLRGEISRLRSERDQLLQISSELNSELKLFKPDKNDGEIDQEFSEIPLDNIENEIPARSSAGFSNPRQLLKYANFEEIAQMTPERDIEEKQENFESLVQGYAKPIIPSKNTERETLSQKLTAEKLKSSSIRKTQAKKPAVRNYNIKDN
ncbi:unnamed protein product [Blepharisma stoltei]|uniref:Uncharacterized protein n=1 Tax=Blepharisma stoltei TaxID=1481888 RepID=A0AAU9IMZ3_9CILI|nr:unnamed protein product [Blepharisma stoltei]